MARSVNRPRPSIRPRQDEQPPHNLLVSFSWPLLDSHSTSLSLLSPSLAPCPRLSAYSSFVSLLCLPLETRSPSSFLPRSRFQFRGLFTVPPRGRTTTTQYPLSRSGSPIRVIRVARVHAPQQRKRATTGVAGSSFSLPFAERRRIQWSNGTGPPEREPRGKFGIPYGFCCRHKLNRLFLWVLYEEACWVS